MCMCIIIHRYLDTAEIPETALLLLKTNFSPPPLNYMDHLIETIANLTFQVSLTLLDTCNCWAVSEYFHTHNYNYSAIHCNATNAASILCEDVLKLLVVTIECSSLRVAACLLHCECCSAKVVT